MTTTHADRARTFRALHDGEELLVLANAWDAISARIIVRAGFAAIATTSSGVAQALGYPDGEGAPLDEIVAATARIARAVDVPVSADMESGFAATASGVGETIRRVIQAGAVGVNLEDVIYPGATLFLLGSGHPAGRPAEALRRARAFLDAGASGIFLPGLIDATTIGELAPQIPAPLNVLAMPGIPSRAELRALGVRRVSLGSSPMRATMSFVRALAAEIRDDPGFAYLEKRSAIPYAEINTLSS
jgi:2-methylisocitrate lyase-like PEP mutase family enzyme